MQLVSWTRAAVGAISLACTAAPPEGVTGLSGETGGVDGTSTPTPSPQTGDASGGGSTSSGGESSTSTTPFPDVPDIPDPPGPMIPQTCAEARAAQTSVGCDFYLIYLPLVANGTVGFAASNVSEEVAHVELSDASGVVDSADVEPGAVHVFERDTSLRAGFSTELGTAGYEMSSDRPLQAFAFWPFLAPAATGAASVALPLAALGTRHRIANYQETDAPIRPQHVTVVATEDDTDVTLRLVNPGAVTSAGGTLEALDYDSGHDTLTVTLDRLEHVVVMAPEWIDSGSPNPFRGSLLESSAPVAVFSGLLGSDTASTAVPPTTVYGRRYSAAKFVPVGNAADIWRFVGNVNGTEIELSGGVQDTFELDAGEVYDLRTSASFWAEGSDPFGMLHMMTDGRADPPLAPHDCDLSLSWPGDRAISWVYAQENWLPRYVLPVALEEDPATPWCHNHLTVTAPLDRWDEVEISGVPLPSPTELGNAGFGYAYVPISRGVQRVTAPDGVGVHVDVYGFASLGSYFYPGGMGLRNINPEG